MKSLVRRVPDMNSYRWVGGLVGVLLAAGLLGAGFRGSGAERPVVPAGAQGREGAAAAAKSAGLQFSPARGFHTRPFELVLSGGRGEGEIRYTTDGSEPGPGRGAAYREPIPIGRTTVVRAARVAADGKGSRAQTHSYFFTSDIIRQSPDGLPPEGWPYAWGENVVDYGMDPSVVDDPKYRGAIEPALWSLPVYSLVMDLGDLFDPRRGIYSNSGEQGREWERAASVELLSRGGRKGFQEECGVRIRGGFSSGSFNPKHAFRLYFRKEYGAGKLKYPVFGDGGAQEFDSFDLRCAQNYSWNIGGDARGLFLRDQFNRDLQRAMGQPAARGDFCHLFVNGQYWGLYDTCERPEASFGAAHFGGSPDDYDAVKTGGVAGGMSVGVTDGTMDAWDRLVAGARANLADNANYFRLLGRRADGTPDPALDVLLDPVNLVDYLLVIWFGGNLDSPVSLFGGNRAPNNWHALRNRKTRDGFRFFVWDAEHTLLDVEEDRTGPFAGGDRPASSHPQWLFQRCADNAEFRVLVADRIQRHLSVDGVLGPASVIEGFQRRVREIEEAVICESARWGDVEGGFGFGPPGPERPMRTGPDGQPRPVARTRDGEWRAEVRRLVEEFLPKRTEIVRFQLWRQGFIPDVAAPRFAPASGRVTSGGGVVVTADGEGEIWYTLDGSDPRRVGGEPSGSARRVAGSIGVDGRKTLSARVRSGGDWGPVVTGEFVSP